MRNNTIFNDDEIMEVFVDRYDRINRDKVKLGMVYFYEHESKCANCLQTILLPYPMTGVWKHKDAGYDESSCNSPIPAPIFFLLELENNPRMNPSGYRQRNAKRMCKKHSEYWDILINEFLEIAPKSKTGWQSKGYSSHFMKDNYQTACGMSVPYNKRNDIFVSDKEPPFPKRYPFKNETCEKCWSYYEKRKQ